MQGSKGSNERAGGNSLLPTYWRNVPGAYARTATQALTNVTFPYVELIADRGLGSACEAKPELRGGINVMNGIVTCPAVAEAHDMECGETPL